MTIGEACDLVVDLTRELSAARADRDAWRRVAVAAVNHSHEQHVELEQLRRRYHGLLNQRRQYREAA
jgi:hypothetical protein